MLIFFPLLGVIEMRTPLILVYNTFFFTFCFKYCEHRISISMQILVVVVQICNFGVSVSAWHPVTVTMFTTVQTKQNAYALVRSQ